MPHPGSLIGCILGFLLAAVPTLFAATYYVAPNGSNAVNGLTADAPLATPQAAIDKAVPGDTVLLRGGVYPEGTGEMKFNPAKHRGSENAWLTIKAYPGEMPILRWSRATAHYVGIWLTDAAYVEISGLTLEGWLDELTLEEARADAKAQKGSTLFNAGGIQADGRDTKKITRTDGNRPHHFRIIGNTIRKFPGGGISFIQCDYLLLQNNTVENCCWYSIWAGSGISIWQSWNLDSTTADYRIRVIGNRLFGNKTMVEWVAISALSDGNGIIIDDFRNTQNKSPRGVYTGRTLVANNLCVNNGGSGIHTFLSDHVDVVHNTAYFNGQQLDYGEIFALDSDSVRIVNNICVARPGRAINKLSKACTNIDYRSNLYAGGYVNAAYYAANNITGEPVFLNPSLDTATADFRLGASSPALDTALTTDASGTVYPWVNELTTDLTGDPRRVGADSDLGAYERTGRAMPTTGLVVTGHGEPIFAGATTTGIVNQTAFPPVARTRSSAEAPVHRFKLVNLGLKSCQISSAKLSGSPAFTVVDAPTWPLVLAPSESSILKVRFSPTTIGEHKATVTLTTADAFTFNLSGTGEDQSDRLVPPTVELTTPNTGVRLRPGNTTTLTATAACPNGPISRVEFYSSGRLLGTATTAPYTFNWTPLNCGPTTVYACAYDARGMTATSETTDITVLRPEIPTTGLLADWRFNEATGTTATDFSGNGRAATLANTVSWSPNGRFGAAVTLDDSPTAKISFEHPAIGAFSFSCWINGTAGGARSPVIFSLPGVGPNGSTGYQLVFRRNKTTDAHFGGLGFNDGTGGNWQTYGKLEAGTWYHLVVTFDGAPNSHGVVVYVNGIARTDTKNYGITNGRIPQVIASTAWIKGQLGNQPDLTRPLVGSLDQVRLYDRVLTAEEVIALYLDDGAMAAPIASR